MRKFNNLSNRGFTLIEVLLVLIVVGILGFLILRSLNDNQLALRESERRSDITYIRFHLESYFNKNDHYPISIDDLELNQSTDAAQDILTGFSDPAGGLLEFAPPTDSNNKPASSFTKARPETGQYRYLPYNCTVGSLPAESETESAATLTAGEHNCQSYVIYTWLETPRVGQSDEAGADPNDLKEYYYIEFQSLNNVQAEAVPVEETEQTPAGDETTEGEANSSDQS